MQNQLKLKKLISTNFQVYKDNAHIRHRCLEQIQIIINYYKLLFYKPQASTLLLQETLFQVDLRAEQLKSYLEKITNTVNGHSSYLNNLQIQLNQVLNYKIMKPIYITARSMSLRDPEFEQQVSFQLEKPLAENGSDQIENATCMVINKERVFSQEMAYLFKRSKDWEAKLNKLEADLMKHALKDELDKGLKEQKTKLSDQIEDLNKKLTKRFYDQERLATQNQNQLHTQVQQYFKDIQADQNQKDMH